MNKNSGGGYRKVINFELLKQMLSPDVLEGDEAYEFTWVGKKASIVEANKSIRKTLRPCKEESVDWDNTENLYLGGEISYDYKDILGISAKYTYRNWDSKTEEYLLAVKPVSEMSFNVRIHPISALNINLGYDYINRKEVKEYAKMTAVNDLHIGASYNVFKGVSVYAQVHNLLNKKYQYYLGYPTEGFNFLGGLSFRF